MSNTGLVKIMNDTEHTEIHLYNDTPRTVALSTNYSLTKKRSKRKVEALGVVWRYLVNGEELLLTIKKPEDGCCFYFQDIGGNVYKVT